jgi:hypothetical protein
VLSLIGDATALGGSFLWSYGGGERRGIREARAALAVSPTGVTGTF